MTSPTLRFYPSTMKRWVVSKDQTHTAYTTGWAFHDKEFLSGESLALFITKELSKATPFTQMVKQFNGNFAAVIESNQGIQLAVDRVRSIPLFYREEADFIVVSDDARKLYLSHRTIDPISALEYATAGYITGPNTLFREIRALQSGEILLKVSSNKGCSKIRYYEYKCSYKANSSVDLFCEQFDEAVTRSFTRLIDSVNGRQIVIPLSGGLDSRLVASMIKKLSYDNVLCVSYGVPNNRDTVKSKQVAKTLGYRWINVPYGQGMWRSLASSDEMHNYRSYSSNAVSIPHCDEWPAARTLHMDSAISNEAVFVPGHTGDFISGGHLAYLFDPIWNEDPHDLIGATVRKHYSLWENITKNEDICLSIKRRIEKALGRLPRVTKEDLACNYEYWEWQERQAKLIINSVRVYEFFGYDWRLPLWDLEIMEFWKQIPINLKMDKYLYRKYLTLKDCNQLFKDDDPQHIWDPMDSLQRLNNTRRSRIRSSMNKFHSTAYLFGRLDKFRKHLREYKHHPVGIASAYGKLEYIFKEPSKRNVLSLMLRDFLLNEYNLDISIFQSKDWKQSLTRIDPP